MALASELVRGVLRDYLAGRVSAPVAVARLLFHVDSPERLRETLRAHRVALAITKGGDLRRIDELDALVAVEQRILDVELTTAHELTDAEFQSILDQIESASGRKVQAERKVDPDLIGGIVLQAGSMRLDASVRGRLERLRQDLTHARS